MTAFVDTNVLVRHLTGDPPAQARRATRFLSTGGPIVLLDLVAAELMYVLTSFYELPRAEAAGSLRDIVTSDEVLVDDEVLLLRAIEVFETTRLAFVDAYLVAAAERSGGDVVSFDRGIDRVGTVRRIEP